MVMGDLVQRTDLLVIGAGPGGYAAAFRAADLGMDVTMVDSAGRAGGVCLFSGCIPSKTFLHLTELITDADRAQTMGVRFGPPQIDLPAMRAWRDKVVDDFAKGLDTLGRKRGVQLLRGRAVFDSADGVRLHDAEISRITFGHCILATGSRPLSFPGAANRSGGRIMDATGALALEEIPRTLLVLGAGYVGLELGTVYAALGSAVTLVEMTDDLLPGVDRDLAAPLRQRLETRFAAMHFNTRVTTLDQTADAVNAAFGGDHAPAPQAFDKVLVAIGRRPNSDALGLEKTGVTLDDNGFVRVDEGMRTSDPRILAVGDVAGGLMLAHKASREGKVAAEVIAGQPSAFDARAIPAVVYTDPQIAWCGLTETEARRTGRPVLIQRFPWKFSGRAATMGAPEGLTKLLVDPDSRRILGMGIVGRHTEGLISEAVLAIEMGALVDDLALSIHPHPTLSETEGEVAEIFLGSATHMLTK
ncbi:MAG: dihydrolipoyl dehydrogenase [Desulfatitalea sp.]|nr:dihydrolipoyl dehydrogenase [Desulfatitalea sp.]